MDCFAKNISCTLSVLANNFLGPKTVQTRKHYKNCGFSGNCPKPKMKPFLEKGVFFDMGEKVGFTNCVFEIQTLYVNKTEN